LQEARDKLANDIAKKIDGCALGGAPPKADKTDWVKSCPAQATVYDPIKQAIDQVDTLL